MASVVSLAAGSRPPSALAAPSPVPLASSSALPPDIIRLVDVLARIEVRRQLRLRTAMHASDVRDMQEAG
jgi:hypothetical protein